MRHNRKGTNVLINCVVDLRDRRASAVWNPFHFSSQRPGRTKVHFAVTRCTGSLCSLDQQSGKFCIHSICTVECGSFPAPQAVQNFMWKRYNGNEQSCVYCTSQQSPALRVVSAGCFCFFGCYAYARFFFFKWLRGLVLATLVHKLLRVLLRLIVTDVERFSFG